jgi:hypothetical protein
MKAAVVATSLFLTSLAMTGQTLSSPEVFAKARDATWAIALLRYAANGQVEHAAFVGGYSTSTPLSVVLPVLQKLGIAKS